MGAAAGGGGEWVATVWASGAGGGAVEEREEFFCSQEPSAAAAARMGMNLWSFIAGGGRRENHLPMLLPAGGLRQRWRSGNFAGSRGRGAGGKRGEVPVDAGKYFAMKFRRAAGGVDEAGKRLAGQREENLAAAG